MNMFLQSTANERPYSILTGCLFELSHLPSTQKYVLQNRILLFTLLNGYITKRQFLILCRKYEIHGELGDAAAAENANSYCRRFFSKACRQGLLVRHEQENREEGGRLVVYTMSAAGRTQLKETIGICNLSSLDSLLCTLKDATSAIDICFSQKKRWREMAHLSHTLGIGDFFASALLLPLNTFQKEICVENRISTSLNAPYIVCDELIADFRADAYTCLTTFEKHFSGHINRLCTASIDTMEDTFRYPFPETSSIHVMLEQDTGSQRKDILSKKLSRYAVLYATTDTAKQHGTFCLLFSCLSAYGRTSPNKQEQKEGAQERQFLASLYASSDTDSVSADVTHSIITKNFIESHDTDTRADAAESTTVCSNELTLNTLAAASELTPADAINIYDTLSGISCILHNDNVSFLLSMMERSLSLPHPGQSQLFKWKQFLDTLLKSGKSGNLLFYEPIFHAHEHNKMDKGSTADASAIRSGTTDFINLLTAQQYASYHLMIKNFRERRAIIENSYIRNISITSAGLRGHMLCCLPSRNLPCLLSFLFIQRGFWENIQAYLNRMYACITSLLSHNQTGDSKHGILLNQYITNSYHGAHTYYFENLSLDLTAEERLRYYLKDYAHNPSSYTGETIVVFFLSDDLPLARKLSGELNLHLPYETGLLKSRSLAAGLSSQQTEVIFVSMENFIHDLPAITFDSSGAGHYKTILLNGRPHLFDLPSDAKNCSVPVEIPF